MPKRFSGDEKRERAKSSGRAAKDRDRSGGGRRQPHRPFFTAATIAIRFYGRAIITSVALIRANASSPGFKASSWAASAVMIAVTR